MRSLLDNKIPNDMIVSAKTLPLYPGTLPLVRKDFFRLSLTPPMPRESKGLEHNCHWMGDED